MKERRAGYLVVAGFVVVAIAAAAYLVISTGLGDDSEPTAVCGGDRGLERETAQRMAQELLALAETMTLNADQSIRDLVETANRHNAENDQSSEETDCPLPSLEDTELYVLTMQNLVARPELASPELIEYLAQAADVGGTSGIGIAVALDDDPDEPPPEFWDLQTAVLDQEHLLHDLTEESSTES